MTQRRTLTTQKKGQQKEEKDHLTIKYNNEQFATSRDALDHSIRNLMKLLSIFDKYILYCEEKIKRKGEGIQK